MKLKILLFAILFALTLPQRFVLLANYLDISINEIAWMGTSSSYNDEWIELYNNTNSSISLDNWTLKAADGAPEMILSGIIPANGFYILERTDDDSLPSITADQIYTGALSNDGEHLKLFDSQNSLIDEANCSDNWFAGDNGTKQTMERINPSLNSDPSNWQTSKDPNGSPKTTNNVFVEQKTEPKQEEPQSYPANIIFNEILPSPEGPDSENEYIEIFNKNDFDADLSNWKIRDSVGTVSAFAFPKNTIIKARGYLVLLRPETKIILNNDGDRLVLINPDDVVADDASYEKAKNGQSINLIGPDWIWSQETTPGKPNIIKTASDLKDKEIVLKEKGVEIRENGETKELASVLRQIPENDNDFPRLFLTALAIAVFSAVMILFLKKAMQKLIFEKK